MYFYFKLIFSHFTRFIYFELFIFLYKILYFYFDVTLKIALKKRYQDSPLNLCLKNSHYYYSMFCYVCVSNCVGYKKELFLVLFYCFINFSFYYFFYFFIVIIKYIFFVIYYIFNSSCYYKTCKN